MIDKINFKILDNARILLVEDEEALASRLVALFIKYGASEVERRGCMSDQECGGLEALLGDGDSFDLVVVDSRLPRDRTALNQVQKLARRWDELQVQLGDARGAGAGEETQELESLRTKSIDVNDQILARIDDEAGIEMLEEWLKRKRSELGHKWIPRPSILLLTALTNPDSRQRAALSIPKECMALLYKPVVGETIVQKAAELIARGRRKVREE